MTTSVPQKIKLQIRRAFPLLIIMCLVCIFWYFWLTADRIKQLSSQVRNQAEEIVFLREQNAVVTRRLAASVKSTNGVTKTMSSQSSSAEYEQSEQTRRRVELEAIDTFYYFQDQLKIMEKDCKDCKKIPWIIEELQSRKRSLMSNVNMLEVLDGHRAWREATLKNLTDVVQHNLQRLQNPEDCAAAEKLSCQVNAPCGFGCQFHHVMYCLIMAYRHNKTLILEDDPNGIWSRFFVPINNDNCNTGGDKVSRLAPYMESAEDDILPLKIPEEFSQVLTAVHGDPPAWWTGQLAQFLWKPQPTLKALIENLSVETKFQRPIVGVHVRRTDKIHETQYHALSEYMVHAEEYFYFLELEQSAVKRRIYLSTDDPSVIQKAVEMYPSYEIISDSDRAEISLQYGERHSYSGLQSIILDIHFLSKCDYLVCTFSSNICRLSYEMMQQYHPDAHRRVRSVDYIYVFNTRKPNPHQMALQSHVPDKRNGGYPTGTSDREIELAKGDLIHLYENRWNGYSRGTNLRTGEIGLYPTYKVKDIVETTRFPVYTGIVHDSVPANK